MASSTGVDLSVSGLASGFDWKSLVTQLAQAERAPKTVWQANQSKLNQQNSIYGSIKSYLRNVQAYAQKLKDPALYEARSALSSSASVASASASAGGLTGTFSFNISHLATAAVLNGTSGISNILVPGGDPNSMTVGAAGFSAPVTAGTFTVNGKQINIATTDSLQQVFASIASATGNTVTASYDSGTDKIILKSATTGQEIVLGSTTDTSNFLQVAQLYNTGSDTVSSLSAVGRANTSATLAHADLQTGITDGGGGNGAFLVNGVTVNYNAGSDTLQNVLDRINSSTAGVNAQYDVANNRFVLTNKSTGDTGVALQDVTGNFLAATGLAGGALVHGQNLAYAINNGPTLVSQSNTIGSSSSGIAGLSVTALTGGITTVTVGSDTSAVQTAVQDFVSAYNNVQSYITTQSASSTDSTGTVAAGPLTGDLSAADLATTLRTNIFSPVSIPGVSATYSMLANLGITSNGHDNTVTLDSSKLTDALTSHLGDVKKLFTDATNGLGTKLDTFLTNTIGDSGTVTAHQAALTKQSSSIDTQIANLEKSITADSDFWTKEFQAMETAQAKLNQELTTLNQQVTNGTL